MMMMIGGGGGEGLHTVGKLSVMFFPENIKITTTSAKDDNFSA